MCLSIPGRVARLDGFEALVEVRGELRRFNALAEPDLQPGDFVLTHTGLVVGVISAEQASRLDRQLREMERSLAGFEAVRPPGDA